MAKKYDALNAECEKAKAEMEDMKKAKAEADAEMKAKAAEEEVKAKAKAAEDVKNAAETTITEAVKDGKIKNDAAVIAKYKASYIANPELTKELIDELPVNRTAPKFVASDTSEIKDSEVEIAAKRNGLVVGTGAYYNYIKQNTKVK